MFVHVKSFVEATQQTSQLSVPVAEYILPERLARLNPNLSSAQLWFNSTNEAVVFEEIPVEMQKRIELCQTLRLAIRFCCSDVVV